MSTLGLGKLVDLTPYETGEEFFSESMRDWLAYLKSARATSFMSKDRSVLHLLYAGGLRKA